MTWIFIFYGALEMKFARFICRNDLIWKPISNRATSIELMILNELHVLDQTL